MKIVGTLDTRNDGDTLTEVLDQLKSFNLDAVYAYDDGSWDGTTEILRSHSAISKMWKKDDFDEKELSRYVQHRRGYLLEQIKNDFSCDKEDIWVVRLEGDRFFLNQSPQEIVEKAIRAGNDSRCGVMLDFHRHRLEGWGELDTFPNWHDSIRNIQRWFDLDDIHPVVAYKITDSVHYNYDTQRPRPWPKGTKSSDYNKLFLTEDMAFFEHHGRRSPKYLYWSISSGNRILSKKASPEWDYSSPVRIFETIKHWYQPYKVLPWIDWKISIPKIIEIYNDDWKKTGPIDLFFLGIEEMYKQLGVKLPKRMDI